MSDAGTYTAPWHPRLQLEDQTSTDTMQEASFDEVLGDVAARLRSVRSPLPRAELDALVQEVVLDVARFVLRWVESGGAAAGAPPPERRSIVRRPAGEDLAQPDPLDCPWVGNHARPMPGGS